MKSKCKYCNREFTGLRLHLACLDSFFNENEKWRPAVAPVKQSNYCKKCGHDVFKEEVCCQLPNIKECKKHGTFWDNDFLLGCAYCRLGGQPPRECKGCNLPMTGHTHVKPEFCQPPKSKGKCTVCKRKEGHWLIDHSKRKKSGSGGGGHDCGLNPICKKEIAEARQQGWDDREHLYFPNEPTPSVECMATYGVSGNNPHTPLQTDKTTEEEIQNLINESYPLGRSEALDIYRGKLIKKIEELPQGRTKRVDKTIGYIISLIRAEKV